jgi:pseudouridine-5'-phosphate glycosidase
MGLRQRLDWSYWGNSGFLCKQKFLPGPQAATPPPLTCPWPRRIAAAIQLLPALRSGMLIAVPVPVEHAAQGAEIQAAIERALQEALEAGIAGAATTPFLLERIRTLTEGRSLETNIHLILNNAAVGTRLAVEVAKLLRCKL